MSSEPGWAQATQAFQQDLAQYWTRAFQSFGAFFCRILRVIDRRLAEISVYTRK